ncbi:Mrp/NBP35 family ATP-binding protein [Oleispirillum naphthae]|uniref:Mrp/NBP35 family ATP-binding protein n=1 Tax=Oleispirillum naphthae TaxID=2838853 RepID=UPI0030825B75
MSTPEGGATPITADEIRRLLGALPPLPEAGDWRAGDHIAGLSVTAGKVLLAFEAGAGQAESLEPFRAALETELAALPGISAAQVILTGEKAAPPPPPRIGQHPTGGKIELPGVGLVVAIASGKGGVGKSTTTANLAMALAAKGLSVGVLDADIYGPSIPTLFGCTDAKPLASAEGKLLPVMAHGIKLISIGFLLPQDAAVIWRGPMVAGAIEQLFRDVDWGALDVLLVDLPPGTGDAQLTMCQKAPLSGAVIVSTPQDLALIDAKRALMMFRKVEVPVLGVVENMSYYECPQCGHREHIFAHGGAEAAAKEMETAFLGAVPLTLAIRESSDAGVPIVAAQPKSPQAAAYAAIAAALLEQTKA